MKLRLRALAKSIVLSDAARISQEDAVSLIINGFARTFSATADGIRRRGKWLLGMKLEGAVG
jgi:hypothetical protein